MEEVSTEYVRRAIAEGEATVVCTYGAGGYEQEHIPGSVNLTKAQIDEFPERFDRDEEIVVYCTNEPCHLSTKVAFMLESMGFEAVKEYPAGMAGWREAGLPVEGTLGTARPTADSAT